MIQRSKPSIKDVGLSACLGHAAKGIGEELTGKVAPAGVSHQLQQSGTDGSKPVSEFSNQVMPAIGKEWPVVDCG